MVRTKNVPPLAGYFKDVKDPRIDRKKLYPLIEVILIALLAVMSHAEGWEDMEDYDNAKLSWLKQFMPPGNGIPGQMSSGGYSAGSYRGRSSGALWLGYRT